MIDVLLECINRMYFELESGGGTRQLSYATFTAEQVSVALLIIVFNSNTIINQYNTVTRGFWLGISFVHRNSLSCIRMSVNLV